MTSGNQAVLEMLDAESISTVFSLLSEELMGITTLAVGEGPGNTEIVQTRHEQSAVAMADGYTRVSGDIGVALIGRGPAIAQTGTALTTACKHGSNVLVIVATRPRQSFTDELNKGFRQETFLDSLVENVYTVWDEETLVPAFADAFRNLHADSGPVVVQVPWDILEEDVGDAGRWEETTIGSLRPARKSASLYPGETNIMEAATLYESKTVSNPPVILAGAGAVNDGASDAVNTLAERLNAVIVTTLQARSFLADHPYMAGFVGGLGDPVANSILEQSDFVLALGATLNDHTTQDGDLLSDGITVHVDTDPAHLGRYASVDLSIVGGASAMVEAFNEELERRGINETTFWTDELAERLRDSEPVDSREFSSKPGRIDPRELVTELDDLLPDDRVVVTDTGQLTAWVIDRISITQGDEFIWPMDFGTIGLGQPIGIGAAHSTQGEPVIVFCGDGGFQMSLQELNTAVRSELPVIIVVINDGALGAEYQRMRHHYGPAEPAAIEAPDFATIAEGFGARAATIRSVAELSSIAESLSDTGSGPIVLDCKVDRCIQVPAFDPDYDPETN